MNLFQFLYLILLVWFFNGIDCSDIDFNMFFHSLFTSAIGGIAIIGFGVAIFGLVFVYWYLGNIDRLANEGYAKEHSSEPTKE